MADDIDSIIASLAAAEQHVIRGSRVAVQKACADTKRDGQTLAAVDTGTMRSSVSYETQNTATGATGEVGPTVNYAKFVEDGTSRMAPQPFMGPAGDRNTPLFEQAMVQLADGIL